LRDTRKSPGKPRRITFERRVLLIALLAGLPGSLVALLMLWGGDYSTKVQWTLSLFICGIWWGAAFHLLERVVFPLQTLSNLLAALREGDYSIRGRGAGHADVLGELMLEVNTLGETLRRQRYGEMEASALLRSVMAELDVAVFTFDAAERLRLVNRAGERLLAQPVERLLGRSAEALGLGECLGGEAARTLSLTFPGAVGRFGLRRGGFRENGRPHRLIVLTDLSQALREEERLAWQRLVRVLGHELNNSLAPIKSMAATLERLLSRTPRPEDLDEDMRRGLAVIGSRSEALARFVTAYTRLARLPQPKFEPVGVGALARGVVGLETRLEVGLAPGPELSLQGDADQLEQLLINLVRNAVDAALETGGGVRMGWTKNGTHLEVWVTDEGMGLASTGNLFVPFFTTKPGGTGIGLVLSRQIAEAHGGSLTLANREDTRGCVARLRLPLS
jgi:two-component system, NtrC family, nitrogen regulation sensor histidine kinase NtrY